MDFRWFTRSLFIVLAALFTTITIAQNVELTTQAEVDAFTGTKVNGYLLIRGNDITDLSNLNQIDTIGHSLFFEYNRKLKVLNGFDNLKYVGGSLFIDSNTELDSIATFGMVQVIKGVLVLRNNFLLRECCALYPLVVGDQGIIKGGTIIEGNKGCKSEKELKENCDADTDNDGVDDSDDGCPNDSLKIHPGICGCGVPETDSDQDGTPDCKDDCPNDPNKIVLGDCGCGKYDTDSDNDGVADCIDDCPYNPAITVASICGCDNPRITNISVANIGGCNDNGTPSNLDDTYPVDVTITFEGSPTSGTLLITGGTTESITFSALNTSKSYTIFGANFKANGELIEVIATFKDNEKCTRRNVFGIFGPKNCSSGACEAPSASSSDTENYTNAALLSWSDLGIGTEYEVSYKPTGTSNWAIKSAKTNQLLIDGLGDYTAYDYRIRSYCDGQKFSDYLIGQFTTGGKECKLIRAEVKNINCADNGTPEDITDDYFSFDLFVEGSNVGNQFTVDNLAGDNIGLYNEVNTFYTNIGTLGNGDIIIVIKDSADENCQLTATVTDPGICSNDCQINYITIDEVYKCYDRGTGWKTSDDYFTADVTVYFNNAPNLGELKLTGNVRGSVATVGLQGASSYTFNSVRVPASGKDFVIAAEFTNGLDCSYSTDFAGIKLKDKICKDKCNILSTQVLGMECASTEDGAEYVTFELIVTGVNLAGEYQILNVAGNSIGNYNQASFFRTSSGLNKSTIEFEIADINNPGCQFTISIDNNCKEDLKITSPFQTDIAEVTQDLTIYPNPTQSELFINYQYYYPLHLRFGIHQLN